MLAAADKDGGAHVDAELDPDYETAMLNLKIRFSTNGELPDFETVLENHLIYIRQMGHELLNSPELLALLR